MQPSAIVQVVLICFFGLTPCLAEQVVSTDAPPPLGAAELDALVAPIALYPDPLIAQILTAATYPLEVVEAAHWLEDPSNAALTGDSLTAAVEHEDWDLSVKSLIPFPDTLRMMERNLQWTEQIGDAFLAQQTDVMDSIQRLRERAISTGSLQSSAQQTVWNQDDGIVVEPASPDVVYVPYYDPFVVYGPWPWPDYAPFSFPPPAGVYLSGPTIVFGIGFAVIRPWWGWSYWNWRQHGLFIPPHPPNTWPLRPGPWRHDPDHRRGLPYRDRDHAPAHTEHPVTPERAPRPPIPPAGQPRVGDRADHAPLRQPPRVGEPPRRNAHPPGQPQGEHAPQHAPRSNQPRPVTEPPAHRPAPPPGGGHPAGDARSRNRPPADHPKVPTGPSMQSRPRSEASGAGDSRLPERSARPPRGTTIGAPRNPDAPAAPRGQNPAPKPQ